MKFSEISNLYQNRLNIDFLFKKAFFLILKNYEILNFHIITNTNLNLGMAI